MTYPQNLIEWKTQRLLETKSEPFCAKCLKLESIDVHQGAPELCYPCESAYRKFRYREGDKNS